MLSAESQFRAQAAKGIKLSEALEQFAINHLKDQAPLVIDDMAFRTLGIGPEKWVPAAALDPRAGHPFWEALGLVYVQCPGGALLTSPERVQELGIDGPSRAADLHDAMAEAILHGQDASGGLFFVLTWLQMPHADPSLSRTAAASSAADRADDFHDMTRWQLVPGLTPSAAFWVVDVAFARAVGVLLALVTALLLWQIQRRLLPGTAFRVCLLALTASAALALWLPIGLAQFFAVPILLVQGLGLLGCLVRLLRPVRSQAEHRRLDDCQTGRRRRHRWPDGLHAMAGRGAAAGRTQPYGADPRRSQTSRPGHAGVARQAR